MDAIKLRGVRTHNLKNLEIEIPYRALTVVTGVSGSGKSSLAFDTLYAEGQRRYVESISAYARQFLERMEKPDLESIQGILPAIAIQAKNVVTNARSTVGTQTELNDYLRLLFARIGKTHCLECGQLVTLDTAESVAARLFDSHPSQEVRIGFPVELPSKKHYIKSILQEYHKQGFVRAEINGKEIDLSKTSLPKMVDSAWFFVDVLETCAENKSRLTESIEMAFRFGKGTIGVEWDDRKHLFSNRFACAGCHREYQLPTPNLFSFNSPLGACPDCQGFGRTISIDWNLVIPDHQKSIEEGVIEPWTKPSAKWEARRLKDFCRQERISTSKPFRELSQKERTWILEGKPGSDYFSVKDFFEYLEKKKYKMHIRVFLSKYRAFRICSRCQGNRLKVEALSVRIGDTTIVDLSRMSIGALRKWFDVSPFSQAEENIAASIFLEIKKRIRFLDEVGLGYLTLDRASRTLSGGESQRINLATSLGSALVDTLYVLDEPSIGLHERDNDLLIRLLHELRDLGNAVVIVEHDRSMIEAADWVIDLGPLGGEQGGEIMFVGRFHDLMKSRASMTAQYFRRELLLERAAHKTNGKSKHAIQILGASHHNLKNISVHFPLHRLVVISGVSGSGKSTLMGDVLYANYQRYRGRPVSDVGDVRQINGFTEIEDIVLIDQSPIGRTPRSNPATYLKVFDDIRKIFSRTYDAKQKGWEAGRFSFNVPGGRCEKCTGEGLIKVEMHFLADVYITCDECNGSRYQTSVLDIRYHGKNIQEVLQMTVDQAMKHFEEETSIVEKLSILSRMGLGYLKLGQPATTLSGGEAQRLKLAVEMTRSTQSNLLYLFDEPTTGLHYRDISFLLSAFDELLKRGHSIGVIEHNMEVIKCADYIVDLGPGGGSAGGEVVYAGPVSEAFLNHPSSFTGQYLKRYFCREKALDKVK
ncbi:MAG: excinuclease ABC subunit UvrA [Candidatus Omnitrophica bacterium]|nr:excinuclease ABC subunit UvrA [Candidatus Omnitrophota bacterium]